MATFLFHETVFGPVKSRRLGNSLGINLLPKDSKFCNFNCIYCECGWNPEQSGIPVKWPLIEKVSEELENKLKDLRANQQSVDAITFAGNGEPTLHPEFQIVVDEVIRLRKLYYPLAKTAILTNGTKIKVPAIASALQKLDLCIVKLDAGNEELFRLINQSVSKKSLSSLVMDFSDFNGEIIVQSLFLKGNYKGEEINNTSAEALNEWMARLKQINAKEVMLYTLDRDTPAKELYKVSEAELDSIKQLLRQEGLKVFGD